MGKETLEEFCSPAREHVEFRDRVRKTLYYGQYSDRSLPSLAVTDVAVEVLGSVAPGKRKRLDTTYAMAVSRRAKISPCTLVMGVLYSERLRLKNPEYLTRISSSDLFLISVMVASKYLYDEGEDEEVFNNDWARAGSKTVNEVNKLEMEFLASIDWSLFISNEDFLDFVNKVESRVATTHGLHRGWFSYADLCTLLDNSGFRHLLSTARMEVFKVISVCTLAYVLSVSLALSVTMLSSRLYLKSLLFEHVTPCQTAEPICRLHRLVNIGGIPSRWQRLHETFMLGQRHQEIHNKSWMVVRSKTSLKGSVFEGIPARLEPEKSKDDFQPTCSFQMNMNSSNFSDVERRNVIEMSEVLPCKFIPGRLRTPLRLSSERTLQQSLFPVSSVDCRVTSLVQSNRVVETQITIA